MSLFLFQNIQILHTVPDDFDNAVSDETLTGSSMAESAALAQFNKSWAELSDWLAMLDNMVQNKRVVVADLDDINDNIAVLKVSVAHQLDLY